jgi:hypothetical protein
VRPWDGRSHTSRRPSSSVGGGRRSGPDCSDAEFSKNPDWLPGSVIYRGAEAGDLRVVGRLEADDPETFEVLVVEPVPAHAVRPGCR